MAQPMRERILKNISWLFADRMFRVAGGLVVGVLVARYLGPAGFGLLSFAAAFVYFFSFLTGLGMEQVMVRELTRAPERLDGLLGAAFFLKLAGAGLALTLLTIAVLVFEPAGPENNLLFLMIGLGFLFQSLEVVDFHFQSKVFSRPVVLARNIAFIVSGLLKILFILVSLDVFWFAVAGTVEAALGSVFMVLAFHRHGQRVTAWRPDWGFARKLLKDCWPLALSTLLITIHMRVDQVMIGGMLGTADVGLYSVAVRLAEFWYFIPALLISSLMPYFVGLRERNSQAYRAQLCRLYSAMFWGGAAVGVLATLFGEWLILLLFGEVYGPAYQALVINVWAGIFVAQGMARGIWLIGENLQKYRLWNNIFAVSLNVAGNVVLIPRMGISGAALSTLLSQGLTLWVFSLVWPPLRDSTLDLLRSTNPRCLLRGRAM